MSVSTLYHGSSEVVEKPAFGKGRKDNDYGQGFYCTEHIDMAREWAVDRDRDGYVNTYELDASDFNVLVLNSPDYCILHWITVLLKNRKFDLESPLSREAYRYLCDYYSIDFSNVDMVIGYRADDSYFSYARDFIDGITSVSQLSSAMRLGELGEQVFIRSKRAFAGLRYLGNEFVRADEWYSRKADRDTKARNAYRNLNKQAYIPGNLYMVRIIDEEVKADDPRLQ